MSEPRDVTLQCPVCGTWFRSTTMDELESDLRSATDFCLHVDGPNPIAHRAHVCPGCDFAALVGSERYEAAATYAERRGEGPSAVADLLLRAAWCCVEEGDSEGERFFRRKAARTFECALARYDDVAAVKRAELTYLVGELWRRGGDDERARIWLDRVADEVVDAATQYWLVRLAAQQRDDPREWLC